MEKVWLGRIKTGEIANVKNIKENKISLTLARCFLVSIGKATAKVIVHRNEVNEMKVNFQNSAKNIGFRPMRLVTTCFLSSSGILKLQRKYQKKRFERLETSGNLILGYLRNFDHDKSC